MKIPISKTGCQGPCKQAPVLSLRFGNRSETFAQVSSMQDWQTVLNFVKAVRWSGTPADRRGSSREVPLRSSS
jgi:(2Fe-2S) ferredoxin